MTSARISWNLPPEELLDADYIPSLWAVRKMMLLVLLANQGMTPEDVWEELRSRRRH